MRILKAYLQYKFTAQSVTEVSFFEVTTSGSCTVVNGFHNQAVFSLGYLWLDKAGKVLKYSENTSSCFKLEKMQAVFISKNKGFSRLYEGKFLQSYTTLWDGIPCPDKYRSQLGHV